MSASGYVLEWTFLLLFLPAPGPPGRTAAGTRPRRPAGRRAGATRETGFAGTWSSLPRARRGRRRPRRRAFAVQPRVPAYPVGGGVTNEKRRGAPQRTPRPAPPVSGCPPGAAGIPSSV